MCFFFLPPPHPLNLLLCLLALLRMEVVSSPLAGARKPVIGTERENCPAYERAALLLAYEIVWLINGLQPSLRFRQRKGFDMNHHWPLVAFVCPGLFFF